MPTSTDKRQRSPYDGDAQPPRSPVDEPRDFETQVSDDDRNYNAPFDSNGEPIEDEDINTHGSER
jgi:hypothetical protein